MLILSLPRFEANVSERSEIPRGPKSDDAGIEAASDDVDALSFRSIRKCQAVDAQITDLREREVAVTVLPTTKIINDDDNSLHHHLLKR